MEDAAKKFDANLLKLIATGENEKAISILESADPSNCVDSSGKSLLHWSILEFGNLDISKYLIDKGCNVNAQDNDGNTPLWLAVDGDHGSAVMELLIEANANIHICNKNDDSPVKFVLSKWILSGRKVVKLFLNKLRDECGDDKQLLVNELVKYECRIYFVVLLRDVGIMRMMLDRGCSVRARCYVTRDTALHESVAQSDFENVKLLVERGADVNDRSDGDETPLYRYDVYTRDTDEKLKMLKYLIVNGATLNTFNKPVMERLMENGQKETISTLLQINDIDWSTKFRWEMTSLHFVCRNENPDVAKAIRLFYNKNVDINAKDSCGYTALMTAARRGFVDTVECLLELGADPNILNSEGLSALDLAYKYLINLSSHPIKNHQKTIDLLLLYGTNALNFPALLNKLRLYSGSRHKSQSIIARLAEMYQVQGLSETTLATRRYIKEIKSYQNYFEFCTRKLVEMKSVNLYDTTTLALLHGISAKQLIKYVRIPVFRDAYDLIVIEKIDSLPNYYSNVLQYKVNKAFDWLKLEEEAADAVSKIIGLNEGHIVAREIVRYLKCYHDLKNLCEVK